MICNLAQYIEGASLPVYTNRGMTTRIYMNNAATPLALKPVMEKVNKNVPWLTYVNAPGYLGDCTTAKYEETRLTALDFVGADDACDDCVFTQNATDGINLLANLYLQDDPKGGMITTCMEHMANYLPFTTQFNTEVVPLTEDFSLDLPALEALLQKGNTKLVTVTGASNVSGVTPNIYMIARMAHQYGAKILVDAVQLVQHKPFDMKPHYDPEHIDFVTFSAHKCYTPFDGGVLIGPKAFLERFEPFLTGSGVTKFVNQNRVIYKDPPPRYEPGYPDIFGIMAMGEALDFLTCIGMDEIRDYERNLRDYAMDCLSQNPKLTIYAEDNPQATIPIIAFNVEGKYYKDVARQLADDYGIEVGAGTVGANIYVQDMMEVTPEEAYAAYLAGRPYGLVRISMGMYNTYEEVQRLTKAVWEIAYS